MNCTVKEFYKYLSAFWLISLGRISSDLVLLLVFSAVKMGYIHTPASVILDGLAADVKQTLT